MTDKQTSSSSEAATTQPSEKTAWPLSADDGSTAGTGHAADAVQAGPGLDAGTIGQTSIALIGVISLILLAGWLFKRFGGAGKGASDRLRVVASRSLGQRERVVIVEVERRWLVLGVTAHNVRTLDSLDAPQDESSDAQGQPTSFGEAFSGQLWQSRERFGIGGRR